MTGADAPPKETSNVVGRHEHREQNTTPIASTHRGVLALCLASFGVMVPWPLLGILVTHAGLDDWTEAILLFGGVTGIPLALLAFFGLPETLLLSLLMLAWVGAVLVPVVCLARRLRSWEAVFGLLGAQAAFSFAQAATGAMMIFGKAV